MKKRMIRIISLILMLTLLTGCYTSKTVILNRTYSVDGAIEITLKDRQSFVSDKLTGAILLYDDSCESCKIVLDRYNELAINESLSLYKVNIAGTSININAPKLEIYKEGKNVKNITNLKILSNGSRIYQELTRFYSYSKMYDITSLEDLKEVIELEKSLILYTLNGCIDCTYLKSLFLNEYLYNNRYSKKVIYNYNVDYNNLDIELNDFYKIIKIMDSDENLTFGRLYYPSFVLYKNGNIEEINLMFNDHVDYIDGKYVISSSGYEDNPHVGKEFSSLDDYYNITKKYYKNKMVDIIENI